MDINEEANRAVKVYKLVRLIQAMDLTLEEVEALFNERWAGLAITCGINNPSQRTRDIVLHVLRKLEGDNRQVADELTREAEDLGLYGEQG